MSGTSTTNGGTQRLLGAHDQQLDTLTKGQDALTGKVDEMREQQVEMHTRLGGWMDGTDSKLNGMKTGMGELKASMQAIPHIAHRVATLEDSVGTCQGVQRRQEQDALQDAKETATSASTRFYQTVWRQAPWIIAFASMVGAAIVTAWK